MLVDKNVKIPNQAERLKYKIPWDEMEIGDSVVVKGVSHVDGRGTIRAQAHRQGIKIAASKEYAEDGSYLGLQIWVVKKKPLTKS